MTGASSNKVACAVTVATDPSNNCISGAMTSGNTGGNPSILPASAALSVGLPSVTMRMPASGLPW